MKNTILINHRKTLGLSQKRMAKMLNIPFRTYQSIEYRSNESAENIYKILMFFRDQKETNTLSGIVAGIDKYLSINPSATWLEIWENVPNKYKSHNALKNSYNSAFNNRTSQKLKAKKERFEEIMRLKNNMSWEDVFNFNDFGYKNASTMKKCCNQWRRTS